MMISFTQKMRGMMMMSAFTLFGLSTSAQTFTHETPYEEIVEDEGDTLNWSIPSTTNLGWGFATITIYYEGDFGADSEYITLYGENNTLIGVTHPYFDGNDCYADSATFTFPAAWLNTWSADNVFNFVGVTSSEVNLFCDSNHAKVKLEYNYCLTGPIAVLQLPQTDFCAIGDAVAITATPTGGTFTGSNISAAGFNPEGLAAGQYTLSYNFTNGSGCTSSAFVNITIKDAVALATSDKDTVCASETATLTATGIDHINWFTDLALTNHVGAGSPFNTPAIYNTTSFYATTVYTENYFNINSLTVNDSVVVDHDSLSGDDRGGIAVTNDYIYIVGDDSTARYDLDLQNGQAFPRMDGLFSDLGNGQLYTLYNPLVGIPDSYNIDSMYVTELRTLNADLTLGTGIITLSDSIAFGYNYDDYQSGIFAGNGFLLLYGAPASSWYAVNLQDGAVTNLGLSPGFYGSYSENWAFWGIAEFTANGYAAIYRDDNNTNIVRKGLPNQTPTVLATFNDISDMASITYAPWNNRWYFHFEGGGDFDPNGDYYEALGYATASDSTGGPINAISSACPAKVTVVVDKPTVNLTGGGSICINDAAVTVVGTPAGGVYAGTGLTGNSFNPNTAGMGTHEITYTITNDAGCTNTDTVTYIVNCTVGIDENTAQNIRMYPNPANESMFVDLGQVNSTSTLKVFDAAGRLIINQNANATSTVKIDVSNLEVGTYILQISGEVNTRKVFIIAR